MPQSKEDKQVRALRKLVTERDKWAGMTWATWRYGVMVNTPICNSETLRLDREIDTLRERISAERLAHEKLLDN